MDGRETSELRDTDVFTRVMARCSPLEIGLAVCAVIFAVAAGAMAPL